MYREGVAIPAPDTALLMNPAQDSLSPCTPDLIYLACSADSAAAGGATGGGVGPAVAAMAALHGQRLLSAYPPLAQLQCKRLAARRHAVTYCYDFPSVFENALREVWAQRAAAGTKRKLGLSHAALYSSTALGLQD